MSLDVDLDRDVCMGSGHCVILAPGVFELDADEVAYVIDPSVASEDTVLAAAKRCPTHAITVRRSDD